jgi:peptidoglycan-associated lipoprotein
MHEHQVVKPLVVAVIALTAVSQSGCLAKKSYVQSEVARVRQEMQTADQQQTQRMNDGLNAVGTRVDGLGTRLDAVERDVQRLSTELADLNVKVTRLNGLIAFHVPVHFDFDKADLRDADQAVLRRFAAVVNEFYPNALITAEGYTDPAGSPTYNQRLGKKRADSVREYLVSQGGMQSQRVRTVSYGESSNRLIEKAAGPGNAGLPNRRVVLVFDYVGTAAVAMPIVMR